MRSIFAVLLLILTMIPIVSCNKKEEMGDQKIIFLHHSTGEVIWYGKEISIVTKAAKKISKKLAEVVGTKAQLPMLFEEFNKKNGKKYSIKEMEFPKASPYGWNNYPFDYYNIWVQHAGEKPFMEEPTLEMLTRDYQVIIFKHCYPVSNIKAEQDSADINSYVMTIPNFKLQYMALRDKLHQFPDTKFILFTGAVQVKANLDEQAAIRTKEFFTWVINEWDLPDDNIYLWDLYKLQTEGDLYFKDEYASAPDDSHPNGEFASRTGKLLFNRIIDVIETNGKSTSITGEV